MNALVYSTDSGRLCPGCHRPADQCVCRKKPVRPAGDGVVRISRQTKGRKGKGVSIVTGLTLAEPDLQALAKALKQHCGCGGAVKEGQIEIQGDKREQLADYLRGKGFQVKLSGG